MRFADQSLSPFFWPVYAWLFFSAILPTRIANYDFRHFSGDDGLTISYSRGAPPLAAIQDERLPLVPTEPILDLKVGRHTKKILAGNTSAWQRLVRYSILFEKKKNHARRYAFQRARRPFALQRKLNPRELKSALVMKKKELRKLMRVSDLVKLVSPVQNNQRMEGIHLAQNSLKTSNVGKYRRTIRQQVEEPLRDTMARRELPSGENPHALIRDNFAPRTKDVPRSPQSLGFLNTVVPLSLEEAKTELPSHEIHSYGGSSLPMGVANAPPGASKQSWKMAAVTPPAGPLPRAEIQSKGPAAPPAPTKRMSDSGQNGLADFETGAGSSTENIAPADQYRISGQVELAGGLAVTGSTKLTIQWKTGNQKRDAVIDYSTGQFVIEVPTLAAGKIFAKLSDETNRVLGHGEVDLDEIGDPNQRALEDVRITIDASESLIRGHVYSAYNVGKIVVPIHGAEVFGAAQAREAADKSGGFRFSNLSSDSTFVLESYAPDHWGTRVITEGNRKEAIPLFSNKMLQSFFDIIGESDNNTQLGLIWGEVKHKGKGVSGVKLALSSGDAIGPIYFNALRIPDKKLTETSENGLFAFVKVRPGLHVVMAQYNNRELPSVVSPVSQNMVSYAPVSFKALQIQGTIFDPLLKKNIGAQIGVVGSSASTKATSDGFKMKFPSTDAVLFVEANPGPEYFISREAVPRSGSRNIEMFAFKKEWLGQQMRNARLSFDESKGLLIGYVRGPEFHVSLDNENYSDQNIFYFDGNGNIDPTRLTGLAEGGAFLLTNLPPGMHTLVMTSAEGTIVTSRLFVSEAGVLNVLSLSLRP